MKTLLLTLILMSTSTWAQVGLHLNQEELSTDQPGVIMFVTKDTLPQTVIHFTQIFQCKNYTGNMCLDYKEGIKSRDVAIKFEDPMDEMKGEAFSFDIQYDVRAKKYKANLRPWNSKNTYRVTREDAGVTVILTVKRNNIVELEN